MKHPPKEHHVPVEVSSHPIAIPGYGQGGTVFGLVRSLFFATKIAEAAKHCHLGVHNFDHANALIEHAKQKHPFWLS